MRVILVRHAQSEGNVMDLRQRASAADFNALLARSPDHPLTPEGEQQAHDVLPALSQLAVQRLYASPFKRAYHTASIIGAGLGLTPVVIPELREVVPNMVKQSRPQASIRRHYVGAFVAMTRRTKTVNWGAEYRRAKIAWGLITAEPCGAVVAVSHGWTINLMLFALRRSKQWRVVSRDVRNAGISIVERRALPIDD